MTHFILKYSRVLFISTSGWGSLTTVSWSICPIIRHCMQPWGWSHTSHGLIKPIKTSTTKQVYKTVMCRFCRCGSADKKIFMSSKITHKFSIILQKEQKRIVYVLKNEHVFLIVLLFYIYAQKARHCIASLLMPRKLMLGKLMTTGKLMRALKPGSTL